MSLTSWASRWCVSCVENLHQVDNIWVWWGTQWEDIHHYGRPCGACAGTFGEDVASQLWNSAIISLRFAAPCCTKLWQRTCCSENCALDGCQNNWHQNTKQRAWSQHWHICNGTITVTNFWIGSSQVMKRGFHTLPQKPSISQCIGVTVDLSARRNSSRLCRQGKWCARCSGTDGPFHSSTSWDGKYWALLRITAEITTDHWEQTWCRCRLCCTRTFGHIRLDVQLKLFNHSPYRPDLSPSDFNLFLYLTKFMFRHLQRFQNDRKAEMRVIQWFQIQAADFYDTGIRKLIPRYDKCLNSGGECI